MVQTFLLDASTVFCWTPNVDEHSSTRHARLNWCFRMSRFTRHKSWWRRFCRTRL